MSSQDQTINLNDLTINPDQDWGWDIDFFHNKNEWIKPCTPELGLTPKPLVTTLPLTPQNQKGKQKFTPTSPVSPTPKKQKIIFNINDNFYLEFNVTDQNRLQ